MRISLSRSFVYISLAALAALVPLAASADVPQVYVQKLTLNQTQFKAGDTVSGMVTLMNQGVVDAQNISYVARIVGRYDSAGNPQATYTSQTFGPMYLAAGESKQVQFSVALPTAIPAADLGIEVQAMLASGLPLGWQDAPLKVSGGSVSSVTVAGAYLIVGSAADTKKNKAYDLEAGPTLHAGQQAIILIGLTNTGSESVASTPTVSVYDHSVQSGTPLITTPHDVVTIAPGKTATMSLLLPMLGNKPGIYAGTVLFVGSNGTPIAETLTFRYIIGGDIATIQAVSADKGSNVPAGEVVAVKVLFSGIPRDISQAAPTSAAAAVLAVALFDQNDTLVASSSVSVDLAKDGDVTVPLTAESAAQALRAEVSITKDGATLASLNTPLSPLYDKLHGGNAMTIPLTIAGVIILFIVAALLYRKFSKKGPTAPSSPTMPAMPPQKPPQIPGALLLAVALCSAAFFLPSVVQAFTITDYCWQCINGFGPPEVFVNTPAGTLQPGEKFYVTGSMVSIQCTNRPQSIAMHADFGGISHDQGRGGGQYFDSSAFGRQICIPEFGFCFDNPDYVSSVPDPNAVEAAQNNFAQTTGVAYDVPWNHKWSHITDRFSMGPFYAPTTPGTYNVNVGGVWEEYFKDGHGRGGVFGYQTFTVAGGPSCVLSPGSATINQGQSTTLSWTSANAISMFIDRAIGVVTPTSGGSVTVAPQTSTTYTGTATAESITSSPTPPPTQTVSAGGSTCNGGWCYWDSGTALQVCNMNGYDTLVGSVQGGSGGKVCGYANGSWNCDQSCTTSCTGKTLTQVSCNNSATGSNGVTTPGATAQCSATIAVIPTDPPITAYCSRGVCTIGDVPTPTPPPNECQEHAHKDAASCVCDAGYALQGASCIAKSQCEDAIDNNGDNLIDANDPGCKGGFGKEGIPDASLKLVPDKNPVQKNQIVTFSYLVENIVSGLCRLSGNNGDSFALSGNAGSQKTSPIQNETKFTLICQALKDKTDVSTSVTIKVAPNFNEF